MAAAMAGSLRDDVVRIATAAGRQSRNAGVCPDLAVTPAVSGLRVEAAVDEALQFQVYSFEAVKHLLAQTAKRSASEILSISRWT